LTSIRGPIACLDVTNRDCNLGATFLIPGFGIEEFLSTGSRRDYYGICRCVKLIRAKPAIVFIPLTVSKQMNLWSTPVWKFILDYYIWGQMKKKTLTYLLPPTRHKCNYSVCTGWPKKVSCYQVSKSWL